MDKIISRVKKANNSNNSKQISHRGPISIVIGDEWTQNCRKIMLDVDTMTTEPPTKLQTNQSSKNTGSIGSSSTLSSTSNSTTTTIEDAAPNDKELKLKLRYQDGKKKHHKEINLTPVQLKDLMSMLENFKSDQSCCIEKTGYKLREVDNSSSSTSLENSINKMKEDVTNLRGQLSKESADRIKSLIFDSEKISSINNSLEISKLASQIDCMKSERTSNNVIDNKVLKMPSETQNDRNINKSNTDKLIQRLNFDSISNKFNFIHQMSKPNRASNNRNNESELPRPVNQQALMDFLYKVEKAVESGKIDPSIFIPSASDLKPIGGRGLSSPVVFHLTPANQPYANLELPQPDLGNDDKSTIIKEDNFPSSDGNGSTEKNLENRLSTDSVKPDHPTLESGIQLKRISKKRRRKATSRKLLSRTRSLKKCLSTGFSNIKKFIPHLNEESKPVFPINPKSTPQLIDNESMNVSPSDHQSIHMPPSDHQLIHTPPNDHQLIYISQIIDEPNIAKINKARYRKCKKFEGINTPKTYSALQSLHSYPTISMNGFWYPGRKQKSSRPKAWPSKTFGILTKNFYPGKMMGMTILKDTMYFIMENRDKLFYLPLINLTMNKLYWEKKFPFISNPKDITSNSSHLFILLANQEILKINTNLANDSVDRWKVVTNSSSDVMTLSQLSNDNILAVCRNPSCLVEFNCFGKVIRIINMPSEVNFISHALELGQNRFVVCGVSPPAIFVIDSKGEFVMSNTVKQHRCYVSKPLVMPLHLAVDSDDLIYVADYADNKLVVLTNQLKCLTRVSFENFTCTSPNRLLYDKKQRIMYFACSRKARWVLASFKTLI